jgi:hypothetical protein
MSIAISPSISNSLPATVKTALAKMPDEQQMLFEDEYKRKAKSTGLLTALAILFPIQLFMLGKTGLGIAFLITLGGMGIWWLIECFLTPSRVKSFNEDAATRLLTEMKIMNS